ncbi:magnesium transporter [Candidatus Saganbacteria bacterium]|nr:magnesium transporter [Candidatus Saganbacteria bacterium]
MISFTEMFASELFNGPVVDRNQENIGRVKDIIVDLNQTFPQVVGLLVKRSGDKNQVKVLLIAEIDLVGTQFIATKTEKDRIAWANLREGDIMLMRDIIDQQIVDLDGARVIRVNDLKLAKVEQDIRLIAVDIGFKGMLRRLGIERSVSWFLSIFKIKMRDNLIGWDHVQSLSKGEVKVPTKNITNLHPSDVAQIISQIRTEDRAAVFSTLSEKAASEALHELEPMLAAVLIANLDTKKALGILEKMPIDETADVLGDLSLEKSQELLRLMRVKKAEQIKALLKHKDETAGGLMTTEFLSLSQNLTVEEVIEKLRGTAPGAETIYYLYIIDNTDRLAGVLTLRNLLVSSPKTVISEIMIKDPITVSPEMNQREVAGLISKYNLLAVPVIDHDKKMLGIVTVDDVIDFILPPFSRRKRQMLG